MSLFEEVRQANGEDLELIYCPTTEFINAFVLENRQKLELLCIRLIMPSAEIYNQLTNKSCSTYLIHEICCLKTPPRIDWRDAVAPCVFKPNSNIHDGAVLYPILCFSTREVHETRALLSPDEWFVQKYIPGQSYYLCGYLSRSGEFCFYWQTNLMQQANGKSIVLARTGNNPGLDEVQFFEGLAEMGYFGPIMMEIIEGTDNQLYFIEINPRFWGPLQLTVDACPDIFNLYASDAELGGSIASQSLVQKTGTYWYAWAKGAQDAQCRLYPAADEFGDAELQNLLQIHDVYRRDDTRGLQGRF
jgi:hypothetical protein